MEEDPFFTDMYEDSGFSGQEPLLSLPSVREKHNPSTHIQAADVVNRYHYKRLTQNALTPSLHRTREPFIKVLLFVISDRGRFCG